MSKAHLNERHIRLFAAAAVLSALILGILIFTVIYQLSKTKTVYFTIWIVAFIAAALSFIGACLLEVGIRDSAKVLANEDALFKFIQTFGKDASLVKTAVGAGWYTTCAWGVYLLIEVVSYFRFGVDLPGKSGSVNAMRKA